MTAVCAIVVDRLDDGTCRASCPVFPELETVADSEEAARAAFERAIADHLQKQLQDQGSHEPH